MSGQLFGEGDGAFQLNSFSFRVSVLDGDFLTEEHSPGGPADGASSHLTS